MFRRKEEGSADSHDLSAITANPSAQTSTTGSEGSGPAASSASQTQHQTSYSATSAQPVMRTMSDMPRPSTPSAAGAGYRPSPVSDFNRGVSRTGTVAHHQPASVAGASGDKGKTNPRILTVGNDILLKGEIATCDRLVIEGRVEAKLSDVHTVEIASSGSFKGAAEIEDAEISGLFEGDLSVKNRLIIYSTGEVRGNITYGEIEIERGGKLTGQIKTTAGSSSSSSSEKSNLLDVLEGKSSRSSKDKDAAA